MPHAILDIQSGPLARRTVELERLGSFTIGRRSANDLKISDGALSRQHCRIDYDGEYHWLIDCESHNGTLVNGQRVTKCMLYDGDVIQVGHTRMVVSIPKVEEDADAEP